MRTLIGPEVAPRRKTIAPAVETAIVKTLESHNSTYAQAKWHRVQAIINARNVGLTNQRIGEILGITEGAVRATISRAEGGK
jgi:DNA-binding NarL/FixJ family response regulator